MQQAKMALQWEGMFIELCIGRITQAQKSQVDFCRTDLDRDVQTLWYDNTTLLKTLFDADNWWSVDDLDHAMGLVFADRSTLDAALAKIVLVIDGTPVTVDPDGLQLSFYAPEAIAPLQEDEQVVCHGTQRQAVLRLEADFEPPFDPSLITLSFLHYPDYGTILIDLDYDGHDHVQFTFGDTTYLKPRFFRKDHFSDTTR